MRLAKPAVTFFFFAAVVLASQVAFAQGAVANSFERDKWLALGAAIAIGVAALGGALGQGRAASAALDGIARNPQAAGKIFTPMIIGLALTESLVLLAFVIANKLSGLIVNP